MAQVTLEELRRVDAALEERRKTLGPGDFDGRGKLNAWQCENCGACIVSRDRDAGVTPYLLSCRDENVGDGIGCGGTMTSKFYRLADRAWNVSHEWIRPKTEEELADALARDDAYEQYSDHLRKGGLHLRRRTTEDGRPIPTDMEKRAKFFRYLRNGAAGGENR